jgi:aspartate/methionine/tyrosine aminotransferase
MVQRLKPSQTLEMLSLAKKIEKSGKPVLHMEVGEPDIPSPQSVKKATIQAIESNFTQYTVVRGILELREKIIENYRQTFNANHFSSEQNVIVTPGAKTSIFYTLLSLINEGDEVIIPSPAWGSYADIVVYLGGKPIFVDCYDSEGGIDIEKITQSITNKTKIILANYPSNPTSRTITKEKYDQLANIVQQNAHIYLLSDEIYSELTFTGEIHSFMEYPELKDQLILISGFSKSHSMTGYRLGYSIAPSFLIEKFTALQGNASTCPTSFVQKAGLAALDEKTHVLNVRKIYSERAKLVMDLLQEIPSVTVKSPQGAFYAFPKIEGVKEDFTLEFLKQKSVAGTPGSAFGPYYNDFIRLSFATSEEHIKEGIRRLKTFIPEYKSNKGIK